MAESSSVSNKTLCIFTPTYNRAYTLPRLYESLKAQTSCDFYWLVVDDGSTDDTQALIATYAETSKFPIRYIKVENGGKQRAHNVAVEDCDSPLFLCVDSDDWLVSQSVQRLIEKWDSIDDKDECSGVVFMKGGDEETPLGTWLPRTVSRSTLSGLYDHHGFKGDSGLMFRTEVLKQYPYRVASGEKFIAESYVYMQIDRKYELSLLHEILCICEYLPDGYSRNIRKITKENPQSYALLKKQAVEFDTKVIDRYRDTALFLVGYMLAKKKNGIKDAPFSALAVLAYPLAVFLRYTIYR